MRDIAHAIIELATCEESRLQHTVYNVTSGISASIENVLQILKNLISNFSYKFMDSEEDANILATRASSRGPLDISRLREDLNYKTEFTIERGLEDYAIWARA